MIPFLARIAASGVSGRVTRLCVEQIQTMVNAPIERDGATDAELDAKVDAVTAALGESREALETVGGVGVEQLFAEIGAGAYDERWRGVARPFVRGSFSTVEVAGSVLVLDKVALDLETGEVRERPRKPGRLSDDVGFALHGRLYQVLASEDGVRRVHGSTGAEIGVPIRTTRPLDSRRRTTCAYLIGGRPHLAIGTGRQIRRYDAETGQLVGPPLNGHRRTIEGAAVTSVQDRPTLFTVDGTTLRRWDLESGDPWH